MNKTNKMKIDIDGWVVDKKNNKILVQIGREFFSLKHEFALENDENMFKTLKHLLETREIKLLKEEEFEDDS